MSSQPQSHYLPSPQQQYYSPSHLTHGQPHNPTPTMRQETTAQRKRPKYTRSKTGCLTCRVKKIKCDETKPNCMRCTHGQRDCTWPEGVPARKKSTSRKDSTDGRPSTANSSVSDGSTPPTRDRTPPRGQPLDLGIPPLVSRRTQDSYLQLAPLPPSEPRRQGRFAYSHPSGSASNSSLHLIPDIASYPQPRYEHSYTAEPHPAPARVSSSARPMDHHSVGQWSPQLPSPPAMLPPMSTVEHHHHSYYNSIPPPPRNILDHSASNDRYHQ
uniref:Zn(2)-C6 fungal-type domain-containing protein n=1 Tax=Moniliophthora roreri TaxID=221103 RepID=A0A0W0F0H2_MONRR